MIRLRAARSPGRIIIRERHSRVREVDILFVEHLNPLPVRRNET
jgi:hypothetical protein